METVEPIKVLTYNNRPDLYDDRYVKATRNMINRYLSVPYYYQHYKGENGDSWFSIEMFKHEPYLFVALDAVITGSLDECVNRGRFTAIEAWKRPGMPNLSLAWVENVRYLYELFKEEEEHIKSKYTWEKRAEQLWLQENARDIAFWPKGWCLSRKWHGAPQKDTKMVVFHGHPKPHECGEWVKEMWR